MSTIRILLPALAATSFLAACMPAPQPAAPAYPMAQAPMVQAPMAQPVYDPMAAAPAPVAATGISGLEERKPDLCGAKNYSSSISQPGSVIPTLGITKQYRVVEYRGIEPQDYDPNRIVFRLDSSGIITNIDCG